MITKKDSAHGRSSTSRSSGENGQRSGVKRATNSGSVESSCNDVLLEHSYCISTSVSLSVETNGCNVKEQQVLHDEQQQQQAPVIDQQEQRLEEVDDTSAGLTEPDPIAGPASPVSETKGTASSERSRRVRRIPAKFMPDDGRLFDDVAEFPSPAAAVDADAGPASGNKSSAVNKKLTAKSEQKQNSVVAEATQKRPLQDNDNEDEDDEEEEEDEDDDDDDPYKEYCICRKPHGNRFMIACDHCEDWFHGSCIGLSKKQSEQYESWVCQTCRQNDPTLIPVLKPAVGTKSKSQQPADRSNQSPEKRRVSQTQSESSDSEDEKPLRIASSRPSGKVQRKKSSISKGQKVREKNGAVDECDKEDEKEKQRLREVIEKAKREHAEKLKRRERRQGPLDPTMNQLFQVSEAATPKSPTKTSPESQRMRCMICRSDRVHSDKTIYCSLSCIKDHVKKVKKTRHANDPQASAETDPSAAQPIMYGVFDAFDASDVLDAKRKKSDVAENNLLHFLIRNPGYALDASIKVKSLSRKVSFERSDSRKSSVSDSGKTPTTPATPVTAHPLKRRSVSDADHSDQAASQKRKDSVGQDEHKAVDKDNRRDEQRISGHRKYGTKRSKLLWKHWTSE